MSDKICTEHEFVTKFGVSECQNCGIEEFEYLKLNNAENNHDDIYCKHCSACGEEDCCSPRMCKMKEDGLYCDYYLELLQHSYLIAEMLHEKNPDLYREIEEDLLIQNKQL